MVTMLLDFAGEGGASSDGGASYDGGASCDGGVSNDGGASSDGGAPCDGGASCDGGVSNDGGAFSDGGACFHGAKRWTATAGSSPPLFAPSPHALAGCVLAPLITLGFIGRCSFSHLMSLDQML
jgi:hypothetical protein